MARVRYSDTSHVQSIAAAFLTASHRFLAACDALIGRLYIQVAHAHATPL